MSTPLTVCLLTRNDQHQIERALRSVIDLDVEIIVAESGSTDRTTELAQNLGARVVTFAWDDDFSAGRNLALSHVQTPWIFWLNPDEELLPASHSLVRSHLETDAGTFGYLARVQHIPRASHLDQFTETLDLRLFRNRPDLQYIGRAQPSLTTEFAATLSSEGSRVIPSEILIRHHAYSSTLDPAKLQWAGRLLRRELEDRPGQLHYQIEYALTLSLLKDPLAPAVFAQAAAQVVSAMDDPAPPTSNVQILLEHILNQPLQAQIPLTREQASALALRWFPDSPALLWSLASTLFQSQQFRPASTLLARLVHLGQTQTYDPSVPFDPRIVGPWALLNLAQAQRALNEPTLARQTLHPLLANPEFAPQARQILDEMT